MYHFKLEISINTNTNKRIGQGIINGYQIRPTLPPLKSRTHAHTNNVFASPSADCLYEQNAYYDLDAQIVYSDFFLIYPATLFS